jgi:hypothetical protein
LPGEPRAAATVSVERSEAMEYEIDDCDVLFDASTNPSLIHRRRAAPSRQSRLSSWNPAKPCRKAVVIPEEEEQLS